MKEEITQKVFDTYCAMVKAQAILLKHHHESGAEAHRLYGLQSVAEIEYAKANNERLAELDRLAQCKSAMEAARERRKD